MTEKEIDIVLSRMEKLARSEGYELTENARNIAKAKLRVYGLDRWYMCPCGKDIERHCISQKCKLEIAQNGCCHCRAYKLKEREQDKQEYHIPSGSWLCKEKDGSWWIHKSKPSMQNAEGKQWWGSNSMSYKLDDIFPDWTKSRIQIKDEK